MPDNIATIDGLPAVAIAREPAWHRLGTVPDVMTVSEALDASHTNYEVVREPLHIPSVPGTAGPVWPGHFATGRWVGDEFIPFGTVGNRYTVIQNREAAELLDRIVDDSGAKIETIGALGNGERFFVSLRLPRTILVGGEDRQDLFLMAHNRHDGLGSFFLGLDALRPVCMNTVNLFIGSAKRNQMYYSLRHTQGIQGKVAEAREALDITFKQADEFEAQMNRLLDQSFTDDQFRRIVDNLLPDTTPLTGESNGWQVRRAGQREAFMRLFTDSETNEYGRGTKYAAFNAVTEYADWLTPVKGKDADGTKRASRQLLATGADFKARGLALLSA